MSLNSIGGEHMHKFFCMHGKKCRRLPQSFVGDGVTGNAYESDCFLATGDDGKSGVFSGSDELMVVKMVSC